jgi:hypothetical protein
MFYWAYQNLSFSYTDYGKIVQLIIDLFPPFLYKMNDQTARSHENADTCIDYGLILFDV